MPERNTQRRELILHSGCAEYQGAYAQPARECVTCPAGQHAGEEGKVCRGAGPLHGSSDILQGARCGPRAQAACRPHQDCILRGLITTSTCAGRRGDVGPAAAMGASALLTVAHNAVAEHILIGSLHRCDRGVIPPQSAAEVSPPNACGPTAWSIESGGAPWNMRHGDPCTMQPC